MSPPTRLLCLNAELCQTPRLDFCYRKKGGLDDLRTSQVWIQKDQAKRKTQNAETLKVRGRKRPLIFFLFLIFNLRKNKKSYY